MSGNFNNSGSIRSAIGVVKKSTQPIDIFERFVPPEAVAYCYKLWDYFGFEFQIKKSRQTKFGDYRFDRKTEKHTITINNDLNPYAFVVTYIHEVAHMATFKEHGRKVSPHGPEWKATFKRAMAPILTEIVFPSNVLLALTNYFKNPKASSCSDPTLFNVLRKFDEPSDLIALGKLSIGAHFEFNGKKYQKLEKRRTRAVCMEALSQRKYLIAEIAAVKPI